MSHKATNWAIQQRGLKPATKILLWHLADCHNPAHGCFPSQEYLAEHCEMDERTVRRHLLALEEMGLISRVKVKDKGLFAHTEYTLNFSLILSPPDKMSAGQNDANPPDKMSATHRTKCPPNPVIDNPVKEHSKSNARANDLDFFLADETPAKPKTARLPENWAPSDQDIEAAKKLNLTDDEIREIADDFHTYWTERTDKGSRKTGRGWAAAWRNNVNRVATQYHRNRRISQQASSYGYRQGSDIASIAARRRLDGEV